MPPAPRPCARPPAAALQRVCTLAVPSVGVAWARAPTAPRAPRAAPGRVLRRRPALTPLPARARWQIYTSAFYHGTDQTLEQAQKNKLNMICEKMHLFKPGMRHLDIGCGWGTLVRWSAKEFGAKSIGVTLSKQGAKWCRDNNAKEKLAKANETDELKQGQCEILVCDYREVPSTLAKQNPSKSEDELLFDVISAVEMAEHVGIANFQLFLTTCRDMLKDDGLFYMQVAGLRKGSNWQDTQWGLFMSRYIFPGADASTPLFWYVKQLEMAGFEVKSVETVRRSLSLTLTLTLTEQQERRHRCGGHRQAEPGGRLYGHDARHRAHLVRVGVRG